MISVHQRLEARNEDVLHAPLTFDELYREHFDFVWRTLRRFGVAASVAEDAAQDSFVILHRKWAELRPEASAKGFLFAIALRVAKDYRRKAHRSAGELDTEHAVSDAPDACQRTAEAQAAAMLETFLDELDEDKRVAFVLADLEGLSAPEIGVLISTNVNTVYARIRAARSRFEEFMRSRGWSHE
ncbi:MAG: sigma-70 family RNA polymerase sigma factor [Myxococcales bacterium]